LKYYNDLTLIKESRMIATRETLEERAEKVSRALKEQGVDALLVSPSPNFKYFTGLSMWRSERLITALFRPDEAPVIFCPAFEVDRIRQGLLDVDIRGWEETEDPYGLCANLLGKVSRIALEEKTPFYEFSRYRVELKADFISAESITRPLRRCKSDKEAAAIRQACAITISRIGEISGCLAPGMSEREAWEQLEVGGMIQFGPTSAIPHGSPGENRLRENDVVLIDAGDVVEGYTSDITRTLFAGEPDDEMRKVYAIVREAQEAAIAIVRAGLPAKEVDRAARRVIEDAGYGANFTHRVGHGLGLEVHEPPYMSDTDEDALQINDVVTIEPGIYLPGRWGVRIEDDVRVTAEGCEQLSEREPGVTVLE
jgi:Xaa-Pro dipeptidase